MKTVYIVTGAAGHLGSNIVEELLRQKKPVRALLMPGEKLLFSDGFQVPAGSELTEYTGNVLNPKSLEPLFVCSQGEEVVVIHCAGIISITKRAGEIVRAVNVGGTKNIIEACKSHGVRRLLYISSVHALPVLPWGQTMREIDRFDPDKVHGIYAKTKAEASQLVMDSAAQGLDAVVVHPGGIIGPNGQPTGNMTQLFFQYLSGRLSAAVRGGYDFVDVRDVASGVVAACEKGRAGECYVLSNRFIDLRELFGALSDVAGRKRVRTFLPVWFARLFAPFAELYYRAAKKPPLFTSYSLYTLSENSMFSHEKATRELGYKPRDLRETLRDTVAWLRRSRKLKA